MNQLTQRTTGDPLRGVDTSGEHTDWPTLIRSACLTLRRASPTVISRISVTGHLEKRPGEALRVTTILSQLASEYDLHASFRLEGNVLTVFLNRPAVWEG
jgi:hypothetical protein